MFYGHLNTGQGGRPQRGPRWAKKPIGNNQKLGGFMGAKGITLTSAT